MRVDRRRGTAALAVLLTGGLVAAGTSVGGGFPFGGGGVSEPDLILVNGEILTMDDERPRAAAIAVTDDEITAVGSSRSVAKLAGRHTQTINLRGRTVIPGLVDGHTHAIRGGQTFDQETYWLDARSLDEALSRITQAASEREPDEWVAVVGSWHPNQFSEKRPPTVADLTEASPTNPVYVQYLYDYALVNEAGIEALGLNASQAPPVPGIVVERDANGQATGRLLGGIGPFNTLVASILPASFDERKDSLENYFTALNESGVTGFIDDSAGPATSYETLFALSDEGRLSLRAGFRVPAQAPGNESAFFESVMAFRAPRERGGPTPFVGMGESVVFGVNDGVRMGPGFQATPEALAELEEVATLAATRRIPLEIHAYTDDAASQILDVFERVDAAPPDREPALGDGAPQYRLAGDDRPDEGARHGVLGPDGPLFRGPGHPRGERARGRAAISGASGARPGPRRGGRHRRDAHRRLPGVAGRRVPGDRCVARQCRRTAAGSAHVADGGPAVVHARLRLARLRRRRPRLAGEGQARGPGGPGRALSRGAGRRGSARSARCSPSAAVRPSTTGGAG